MKKIISTAIITGFALLANADVQTAKVSEKLKAIWSDPVLQEQLDAGIKANRMSDFFLKFIIQTDRFKYNDVKVSDLKVEQIRHDFRFGCNAFLIDGFRNEDGTINKEESDKYGESFAKIFNLFAVHF